MRENPDTTSARLACHGVHFPFDTSIITPRIERPMRNNRYEIGEVQALRDILKPEDRVLDLGAGIGLIAAVAARIVGSKNVTSVEANPALLPMIRSVLEMNDLDEVDLRHGIVAPAAAAPATFYLRHDFWASSIEPDSRPFVEAWQLPVLGLGELLREVKPTIIVCDVERAELDLFDEQDLSGVRAIILETHPKVYGEQGKDKVLSVLQGAGLSLDPRNPVSTVRLLTRASRGRPSTSALAENPRILVATCMKDEGPFILEWLAWHKAIGITDFVVFTNDCSDGTTELLDHLADLGEVQHLPNPALAMDRADLQPVALRYVQLMREFRRADYFISMDVDEFINVRLGRGHISDLLAAVPEFDVLSMSEILHGSNGRVEFEDGLVTEQFPRHQTELPGWQKRNCGVKSIVRLSDRIARVRNHRPDVADDVSDPVWLDA